MGRRGGMCPPRVFCFGGSFVNRLISTVVAFLLALVGSALAGYWNSKGVVPIGDARVPGWIVGVLIVGFISFVGLVFGGLVPWKAIFAKVASGVTSGVTSGVAKSEATSLAKPVIADVPDSIPVRAAHLLECVYHLRIALNSDDEGQELLDQIQIKVGRVSAKIATKKESGGE